MNTIKEDFEMALLFVGLVLAAVLIASLPFLLGWMS